MRKIRFLDHGDGIGSKRKQTKRACDSCRKGKRKCCHDISKETAVQQEGGQGQEAMTLASFLNCQQPFHYANHQPQDPINPEEIDVESQQAVLSELPSRPTAPFAGASSARSLLLSLCTNLETVMDATLPPSRALRPSFQDMRAPPSERRPGITPGYLPMVVKAVLPYLEIECLQVLPPQQDLDAIIQVYKDDVHPILPIVDFNTRALTDPVNRDNPATIVLRQAICLAACKNASARQHLYLPETESENGQYCLKTPRDFADSLFGSLKIAQDIGLVDDRVELVQVLALMTFHSYGPDGDDEVARLCCQAIHFTYSAGLHYPSQPEDPISEARRVEILCSLFALDKIVAMITGRPAMFHRNEIYLPAHDDDIMMALSPGLVLLFRLCQMLDSVLGLYRACPPDEAAQEDCIWEASWPEFEDLVKDSNAHTMQPSIQACLELLYHVIGVISYRPPHPTTIGTYNPESMSSHLANQNSRVRYKYCAQQISSLLSLEISKFPFIPYAASLSLTVALRNMQYSTLETTRRMARYEVERSIRLLDELTQTYWHAEPASALGLQLLQTLP